VLDHLLAPLEVASDGEELHAEVHVRVVVGAFAPAPGRRSRHLQQKQHG
jgi:hypothetical protein